MRLTRNLIIVFGLITIVVYTGCGGKGQPSFLYFAQAVDADENGVIDENDIPVLEENAHESLNVRIRPSFSKAGVEVNEENGPISISKSDEKKLKDSLTVTEWEQLMESLGDYHKLLRHIEATKEELLAAKARPIPIYDSGTVGDFIVQANGDVTFWLKGGRQAQLIGIKIADPTTGYLLMCRDYFYELALNLTLSH